MRVIFLDIDGVLNSEANENPRKFPYVIDTDLLKTFVGLVDRTKAHVVLTSTWRCDPIGVLAARHYGVPFHELAVDKEGCERGSEIGEWLRSHPKARPVAVIDDDNDGLDGLPLFQPSPETGLTPAMADAICNYLEGKTDQTLRRPAPVRLFQEATSLLNRATQKFP